MAYQYKRYIGMKARMRKLKSPNIIVNKMWKEMFYLTTHSTHFIYGYMASDSERENPLSQQGLLFPISSKGSFICIIRQDDTYHGLCYTSRGVLAGTRNSSMGPL